MGGKGDSDWEEIPKKIISSADQSLNVLTKDGDCGDVSQGESPKSAKQE